jgi:hypothetical protein
MDDATTDPLTRLQKRRDRIREQIERNRRGEYAVPTWVLAVALVAFVAVWGYFVFAAG